ncbi:hypothetical protein Slin14017_G093760 [Septoria linicola]|nr:hypothetical protein Slin14017_G093760 [Septoria linicola]
MAANNQKTLQELLESLPPELFVKVYDYVFVLPETRRDIPFPVVQLTESYRPPKYLQINAETRKHNQARYYAETLFVAPSTRLANKILASVNAESKQRILDQRFSGFSGIIIDNEQERRLQDAQDVGSRHVLSDIKEAIIDMQRVMLGAMKVHLMSVDNNPFW